MSTRSIFLATSLALLGCTSATPIRGPNGEEWVFLQCDSVGIEYCYQEAAKACPGGYRTIEVVNEATPRIILDPIYNRNITVECL